MNLWHAIGRQFQNPSGVGGQAMGHIMRAINRRPNREAIAALEIQPEDRVLDLGCGPGAAVRDIGRIATRGWVCGIDQSQVMIDQAARRNRGAITSGKIVLYRAAFERLPLAESSIDRVLAVNVAYFWTDMPAVLSEIGRVLRPGGTLSIYVTDAQAMRRWKFAGPQTHRLFDASDLRQALTGEVFPAWCVTIAAVSGGPGIPGLIAVAKKPASDNAVGAIRL